MEEIPDRKVEYGVKSLFKTLRSTQTQDNGEAIRLFQMCRSYYFYLLLTTAKQTHSYMRHISACEDLTVKRCQPEPSRIECLGFSPSHTTRGCRLVREPCHGRSHFRQRESRTLRVICGLSDGGVQHYNPCSHCLEAVTNR